MKFSTISRLGLVAPLALTIAACGGGGGGGGTYANVDAIKNVSAADIQNRTGVGNRQAKSFSNAAIIGLDGENRQGRFAVGTVAIGTSQEQDGGNVADPYVTANFDVNGDNVINVNQDGEDVSYRRNYNPDNNPIRDETGELLVQYDTIQVGGESVVRASHVPNFNTRTVVYVPADAAQNMRAGMVVHTEEQQASTNGAVGIFGVDTTATEMAAQRGSASYTGIASANVARDPGASGVEGGLYEGSASAQVDFDHNSVTTNATLTRSRTAFNVGDTDTILVGTSGTYSADGSVNGSAEYSGLVEGRVIRGDSQGQFYGANTETLGMTYTGNDVDGRIAGGLLVNRTDD